MLKDLQAVMSQAACEYTLAVYMCVCVCVRARACVRAHRHMCTGAILAPWCVPRRASGSAPPLLRLPPLEGP